MVVSIEVKGQSLYPNIFQKGVYIATIIWNLVRKWKVWGLSWKLFQAVVSVMFD